MSSVDTEWKEEVGIILTNEEIQLILKCVSMPIIQTHWKKEEAELCKMLTIFFKEILK